MNSSVSVLRNSAATLGLVESHETSTMRFVPEALTLMLPAAIPTAAAKAGRVVEERFQSLSPRADAIPAEP